VKRVLVATVFFFALAGSVRADEEKSLEELLAMFDWSFETTEIRSQQVADRLHVLFGLGGNIAVSIGDHGVLIVDDQFPDLMPKIEKAIADLGGKGVDFAINTHWHFDHADGNIALGPAGTWIVSQRNSRARMLESNLIDLVFARYRQEPYPEKALPVIAFDERMSFHFNGEQIDLIHAGPAHTTGDAAVVFRGSNAVHFGDVFNNTGYPFIDAGNGGEIDGMIAFCRTVRGELDDDTIVIPGHGEVTDVATLDRYIAMLETARERIAALVAKGASLAEVIAAKPTADLDEVYGDVEFPGFPDESALLEPSSP